MRHPSEAFAVSYPLTATTIHALHEIFHRYCANKGTILENLSQQNKVLWVESGMIRAYKYHEGRDITAWFVTSQQFLYSAPPHIYSYSSFEHVEFLDKTSYWLCDWDKLQQRYDQYPDLANAGRNITERLLRSYNGLIDMLRLLTPTEKLQYFEKQYAEIYPLLPLKHLASFLGIAPETLSRIRSKRT